MDDQVLKDMAYTKNPNHPTLVLSFVSLPGEIHREPVQTGCLECGVDRAIEGLLQSAWGSDVPFDILLLSEQQNNPWLPKQLSIKHFP